MACECAECARYEGPNPRTIKLRFFVLAAQFLVGVVGLIKARSWKALEAVTLATMANAPAIGMRKNKKLLGLYMMLSSLTMALQFLHSCRHGAPYATVWRKPHPGSLRDGLRHRLQRRMGVHG